jgi:hypothetical protein
MIGIPPSRGFMLPVITASYPSDLQFNHAGARDVTVDGNGVIPIA